MAKKKKETGGLNIIVNGEPAELEITEYKDGKPVKTTKRKRTGNPGGKTPTWIELDMPSKLEAIAGWCKQGYTDDEMAKMLGIGRATWYRWCKEYPEFKKMLVKNKHIANGEVLNSIFRQSTGYYVSVTEPVKLRDDMGAEHVEMVTYDKYIPPNSTTSIFLLKNRMPRDYRDKQETEITGDLGIKIEVDYGE